MKYIKGIIINKCIAQKILVDSSKYKFEQIKRHMMI